MKAVDEPSHDGELREQLGAGEQLEVAPAALQGIGLLETLEEGVGGLGEHPGDVLSGVAEMGGGEAGEGPDRTGLDDHRVPLQVPVDGGGGEAPQRHLVERRLPTVPQVGGDEDLRCGLVEQGQEAVPAFLRGVRGQVDAGVNDVGQIVEGG